MGKLLEIFFFRLFIFTFYMNFKYPRLPRHCFLKVLFFSIVLLFQFFRKSIFIQIPLRHFFHEFNFNITDDFHDRNLVDLMVIVSGKHNQKNLLLVPG
jgi:hypothetical protein